MINLINDLIARFINTIADATRNFWETINVAHYSAFQIIIDILLVALLFYWLIMLIRGTRATNIFLGLLFLILVFAVSRWLNLLALGWLLDRLLTVVLVAIPIIFQQELRRGLEKLGRTKFFLAQEAKEIDFIRSEIIEACVQMAAKKIGALIVIGGDVNLKEYMHTGVQLNARISKELLLSLFSASSPLHDGAVIIEQNLAAAAGCVLPHSFKEYGHNFGTRHKAALALSEATDAKIFVISEQRGTISYVHDGELEETHAPQRMEKILAEIFTSRKLKSSLTLRRKSNVQKSPS